MKDLRIDCFQKKNVNNSTYTQFDHRHSSSKNSISPFRRMLKKLLGKFAGFLKLFKLNRNKVIINNKNVRSSDIYFDLSGKSAKLKKNL